MGNHRPGRISALPSSGKGPLRYRLRSRAGTTAQSKNKPAKAASPKTTSSGNGNTSRPDRTTDRINCAAVGAPSLSPSSATILIRRAPTTWRSRANNLNLVINHFDIEMKGLDEFEDAAELRVQVARVV